MHFPTRRRLDADLTVELTRQQLLLLLAGHADGATMRGDESVLPWLLACTDTPDPDFAVVTP